MNQIDKNDFGKFIAKKKERKKYDSKRHSRKSLYFCSSC